MNRGQLSDYFEGVGVKRLSAVDADPERSNQHEIGTTKEMREGFLGQVHQEKATTRYVWLGGDQDGFTEESWSTHYDSRLEDDARSAEWRLYYPTNPVTEAMRPGDSLFLAKDTTGVRWFIVAPQGSTSEQQLFWLFDRRPEGQSFVSREFSDEEPTLDFAARFILDEIGVEFEEPEADKLDTIIDKFGTMFPKTAEFSDLARLTIPEVRAEDDPDSALIAWLDHEEALFRRLERRVVSSRIEAGFVNEDGIDIDGFISYSLSVQNRRKSRRGYSLEHHLEAVFRAHGVQHIRGAVTEHNHKPDFLFPNLDTYQTAPPEGNVRLTMLGAKSSCKDRWRQVLAEAEKISRKHLLTLEPRISEPQTQQMEASSLQLVVPQPIQSSYTDSQQGWLWSLADFIEDVRGKQT
ncbi:MAG: type II restriction endonuclease [Rhizobiaceae bacterium]|nr:type II restriction endonuclease [Rhizobiaceae bacterium]|tara:strand:+ start:10215 stop:11435 length:1221 start_codon:yes stop_codon:yes gene_type:complete